jgi:hypothetical protein
VIVIAERLANMYEKLHTSIEGYSQFRRHLRATHHLLFASHSESSTRRTEMDCLSRSPASARRVPCLHTCPDIRWPTAPCSTSCPPIHAHILIYPRKRLDVPLAWTLATLLA